jgi:hypothetical protein
MVVPDPDFDALQGERGVWCENPLLMPRLSALEDERGYSLEQTLKQNRIVLESNANAMKVTWENGYAPCP